LQFDERGRQLLVPCVLLLVFACGGDLVERDDQLFTIDQKSPPSLVATKTMQEFDCLPTPYSEDSFDNGAINYWDVDFGKHGREYAITMRVWRTFGRSPCLHYLSAQLCIESEFLG